MKKFYQITNKSFKDLAVATTKELWDKVKGEHKGLSMSLDTTFTKAEGSENKFDFVFSTANQDRHGDFVLQNWDLKHFKKNPVFLDSHNYGSIEHILGKISKVAVKDRKLRGIVEYALDNPKGLLAFKMTLGGFINATSVGFIPKDFDEKGQITKSELLEVSAVSVPANAEALLEKGIKAEDVQKACDHNWETLAETPRVKVIKCADCEAVQDEIKEEVKEETVEIKEEVSDSKEEEVAKEEETVTPPEEKKAPSALTALKNIDEDLKKHEARKAKLYKQASEKISQLASQSGRSSNKQLINKAIKNLLQAKD